MCEFSLSVSPNYVGMPKHPLSSHDAHRCNHHNYNKNDGLTYNALMCCYHNGSCASKFLKPRMKMIESIIKAVEINSINVNIKS